MGDLRVGRRTSADDEELFCGYAEVFGSSFAEASRRRWQWQYRENPHTGADGPEIWVAKDGETVLGQYASMPVRLWWGGREVRSSWGMDVFVSATARGRGVGAALFTTWSDHVEVALGLGLTPSSYGLFKKLRYADVGPVPFYRKVLDPSAVARRRLGTVFGSMVGPALGLAFALTHPERRQVGLTAVEPITGFGAEYDTLWEKARSAYAMCVRRDAAYLEWKYARAPHRRYILLAGRRGGELVGFAVGRDEDYRGLRLGWVIDVFTDVDDDDARGALLAALLDTFRERRVARVQAFAMHAALGAALERRGFARGASPMQFCVRARVDATGVFDDLGRWHVVFGDSDMDR